MFFTLMILMVLVLYDTSFQDSAFVLKGQHQDRAAGGSSLYDGEQAMGLLHEII